MSNSVPLRLSLDPILPNRTPTSRYFEYGFRLRLPDGPAINESDPLLELFGARVVSVAIPEEDEQHQDAAFDPGSMVRLLPEPGVLDDTEVGVWDDEGLRCAGMLFDDMAAAVGAAIECDLTQSALVLAERRSAAEDRRHGLDIFIYHPGFVEVDTTEAGVFQRPKREVLPRLVLVADGSGDVRWWDPTAANGPIAAADLPMSSDLSSAIQGLRAAYAEVGEEDAGGRRGFEHVEAAIDHQALDAQAVAVWQRARTELGRQYAIGFLGTGMERPVWTPDELYGQDEEY